MSWNQHLSNSATNYQKLSLLLSDLDQRGKVQAEYIWIGGSNELRSKTRTLNSKPKSVDEIPHWNYDGSSTNQAPGDDSEVIIVPRAIFADPFRRGDNILVLCDTYDPQGNPLPTNTRAPAKKIFDQVLHEEPWFGIEQEFVLTDPKDKRKPYGWPEDGYPAPQGPYYCAVGASNAIGREILEAHYKCCLHAGVKIYGINAEVMPSQWEFQVGTCEGIEIGDHLWIARYILLRVAEIFNVGISFEPKVVETGKWNCSGGHCNFSTLPMRKEGGLKAIESAIEKLKAKHKEHIAVYGEGNEKRLTGLLETSDIECFSWGYADRGSSIRVGRDTQKRGFGYMEDRRPSSNSDPYLVSSRIVKTIFDLE